MTSNDDVVVRLQGRWWLPEHPEHCVCGTLTWSIEAGGTLHLLDELHPVVWVDNVLPDGTVQKYRPNRPEQSETYPLIFGQVEGKAYTLLDSFRLSAPEYGEDRVERVHVNRFLQGAWFDDPDELRVDRVVIDMAHLTGWVGHTGLNAEWPRASDVDTGVLALITAKRLPAFTTEHERTIVRLAQALNGVGDHVHRLGITQTWALQLETEEPEALAGFLGVATNVQHLVSIAAGQTAEFTNMILQHPNVAYLSPPDRQRAPDRENITYWARWSNRSAVADPVKDWDMYFTFDDLGGIDGVHRWLSVAAEYRTELSRVMATRYVPGMVLEDRLMNVAAALDSFDTQRRDVEAHYVERIEACATFAGQPFLSLIVTDPTAWAESVRNTRNDLAHHRERFRTDGSVGDHLLADQLFWLFSLCVLRLADAPDAVYERITRHRQIRWLTERAGS